MRKSVDNTLLALETKDKKNVDIRMNCWPMNEMIQKGNNRISETHAVEFQLRKIGAILILLTVDLKFLFDIVLSQDVAVLNALLYFLILTVIDYRRISWDFFLIPLFVIISVINRNALICVYVLTILYVLKNYSLRFFACSNVIILFSIILLTYFLINIGVVTVTEDSYLNLGRVRTRMDFGFGNPNQFAIFCFSLLGNLFILLWRKHKLLFLLIFLASSFAVTEYTDSRTFQLSSILLILLCIIQILGWDKSKPYQFMVSLIPILILLYSTILPYNDTYGFFNALSSGRMGYYKSLLDEVTMKDMLIGTSNIQDIVIDSTYLHLVFEGGIIFFIIFYSLYLYVVINRYSVIYPYLPIVVSILIYGAFETFFANSSNTGNLLIWMLLYRCYLFSDKQPL